MTTNRMMQIAIAAAALAGMGGGNIALRKEYPNPPAPSPGQKRLRKRSLMEQLSIMGATPVQFPSFGGLLGLHYDPYRVNPTNVTHWPTRRYMARIRRAAQRHGLRERYTGPRTKYRKSSRGRDGQD